MNGSLRSAGRMGAFLLLACCAPAPCAQAAAPAPSHVCPFDIPASEPPFRLTPVLKRLKDGEALRVLAIGSSSTAGFGSSSPAGTYPAQLAARLGAALAPRPVDMVNAGVSGETGPNTLARLKAALGGPSPPHIVIWQVGTNDVLFGGTPERLAQTVDAGLTAIAGAKAEAIVMDQQYFPAILDLRRYETFVAAVDRTAAAHEVALLPRYELMKQWAVADRRAFGAILAFDRFHMSDQGYACLADLLAAGILAPPSLAQASDKPDR